MKASVSNILLLAVSILFQIFTIQGVFAKSLIIKGSVKDVSKQVVADAVVYLIPSSDVAEMGKSKTEIKRNALNDEPLEDNLALNKDKYKKAVTDKKGNFKILDVADGKYFVYVVPVDTTYLPGGDKSNTAITASEMSKRGVNILISGNIPVNSEFVGTSKCLTCHKDYASEKMTLHKLGIRVAGKDSKLQDSSRFANFDDGLKILKNGATFYFYSYDKSRGFDKYLVSQTPPKDMTTVSMISRFFVDEKGDLKVRNENFKNSNDPAKEYTIDMTYGGGLYKQRYLVRYGKNLFPFLQYNSYGDDSFSDRTRKKFRDYHADWFYDEEGKKLKNPPIAKSFEKECASCHYTGYTLNKLESGEYIAGAVNDPNGEFDIDGDGMPNELNIGCESCHGAGSAHIKAPIAKKASTIVSPNKLSTERASVICGQCHSRPQGFLNNDQPVNKEGKMMIPGTSRNDYLINYTTREDAAPGDVWESHSKSHHQQYLDFIRSTKYRNGNKLMSCSSCHDPHGKSTFKHQMRVDVITNGNDYCQKCHTSIKDIAKHTEQKVGVSHEKDTKITCTSCHMPKTAQTGAGFGKGLMTQDGDNYWQNDITSHMFTVPRKESKFVKGLKPGKAMSIPYTNACGQSCHDTGSLK